MGVRFEKPHAAGLGDEMRRLRERQRVQAAADAVGGLEQAHAQMRLFLAQTPGGIDAGDAAADDGDVEIGLRPGARDQRRQRERRAAGEKMASAEAHRYCGARVRSARRAPYIRVRQAPGEGPLQVLSTLASQARCSFRSLSAPGLS